MDGTVRSKAVNLGKLRGVVNEEADFLAVLLRKMLLRHLKRLIHPLAYSHARHHHDELAPAVVLVQFVHGFDIGVGLADTSFHFDGQIEPTLQPSGRLYLIGSLDFLNMLQDNRIGKFRHQFLIAPTCKVLVLIQINLISAGTSVHPIGRRQIGLPGKHIHHRLGGIRLKLLMLEL